MLADRKCCKLGIKMFFGIALASSLLCAKASAQQLTSCNSSTPSTPCIKKFLDPLPYPPFFQSNQIIPGVDSYEIAARQFQAPVLSSNTGLVTTVWGYGANGFPYDYNGATTVCNNDGTDPTPTSCFSVPSPTIFTQGTVVHVKWINDVVCHAGDGCTPTGQFFTYTPGVKPSFTNHWANPGGTCNNHATGTTDCQGIGGYTGPVPLVVHAHGEIAPSDSDGIPEAWNLPRASSFSGFIGHGSDFCQSNPTTFDTAVFPGRDSNCRTRSSADSSYKGDGAARFTYPNRQFGTTLFFHDHALGVTTENVYMGLAGFYLISGTNFSLGTGAGHWCNGNPTNCGSATNPFTFADDLPTDCSLSADNQCHLYGTNLAFLSTTGGLPQGDCSGAGIQAGNCFLVPLAIGDRAFNLDGSLKFSENGNVIIVNGKSWPIFTVQPRKYRFKMVVAAPTSRFDFTFPSVNNDHPGPVATMTLIGADSGNLPHPAAITKLSLMPGERADVIVDFSQFFGCAPPFGAGCTVDLLNANGGGDKATIMRFNVGLPIAGCDPVNNIATCYPPTADTSCNLSFLTCTSSDNLPHRPSGSSTTNVRQVSLFDDHLGSCGPLNAQTNCLSTTPLPWDGSSTENPVAGSTEIWELWDFQDSHPMHLHEAQFEVINREKISCVTSHTPCPVGPGPSETGFKDTVQANAGQVTRLRVIFKGPGGDPILDVHPGLFAWHCHINPHEDNEMMRPMCVVGSTSSTDAENFCK